MTRDNHGHSMDSDLTPFARALADAPLARIEAGLPTGTPTLTMDGELPVDHLSPGDRIVTRDGGAAVLRSVGLSRGWIAPIEVARGCLGHDRPDRAVLLAPETLVHLRDWRAQVLFGADSIDVPAHRLIDGRHVRALEGREVTLVTLGFDAPRIVYAAGLEVRTG